METLESIRRKIVGAKDIKSVVRTMKAVAASNIGQYELAVNALSDYYRTVTLGVVAYLRAENIDNIDRKNSLNDKSPKNICAIVFGSDQGLVGSFNNSLTEFVSRTLASMPGNKEIWAVGERVQLILTDIGLNTTDRFIVPGSVNAIAPLVGEILVKCREGQESGNLKEFYVFHNQPKSGSGYEPSFQRLLPLDEKWIMEFTDVQWPAKNIPQIVGDTAPTLLALISEYLFVTLFKACAESLASENASRLSAMQRAEKNIDEMLTELNNTYHHTRQSSIDEELFDVVSGFEALKKT